MGSTLARRGVAADVHLWTAWARAVADLPDNPYGAEVRAFGETQAVLTHSAPITYFNRVLGMTSRDLTALPEVSAFYRDRQTPCRIDVADVKGTALLSRRLSKLGWIPVDHQANLAAPMTRMNLSLGASSHAQVREVVAAEAEWFAELYDHAYGLGGPPLLRRFRRASVVARIGRPGWHAYVAELDGRPAGGGLLHVDQGVATLTGGATLPTCRNRGVQAALLRERLRVAADLGSELAVARCAVGSASERNLLRAGLSLAYLKQIWEAAPRAEDVPAKSARRAITAA